jgi:hypothetical protein
MRYAIFLALVTLCLLAPEGLAQAEGDPPMPANARSLLRGKVPSAVGTRRPPTVRGRDPKIEALTQDAEKAEVLLARLRDREVMDEDQREAMRQARIERLQRPFGRAGSGLAAGDRYEEEAIISATPRSAEEYEEEERAGWSILAGGGLFAAALFWLLRR